MPKGDAGRTAPRSGKGQFVKKTTPAPSSSTSSAPDTTPSSSAKTAPDPPKEKPTKKCGILSSWLGC